MAGTYFNLADNAETTLNGALTDVATSIVVTSATPFPASYPYLLTIWDDATYPDPSDDPDMEIVLIGGATGNTLTSVTRGYGSTSEVAHSTGNRIALLITKEILTDSTYGIEPILDAHLDNVSNPHTVTAAQLTGAAIVTEINSSASLIDDDNIAATIARDSEVTSAVSTHAALTATHGVTEIVGKDEVQTLTNKTFTTPTITLKQSATPTPTAEGDVQWDTDGNQIKVGDGATTKTFSDDSVHDANYAPIAKGVTNGDSHDHNGGDGAQIDHVNLTNKGTTTHADLDLDHSKLGGIEAGAKDDQTASEVPIVDTGSIITATEVEGALQENRTAIDLNTAKVTNATHTGEVTGDTALTIANNAVTNAKLADVATSTIKGRATAATGDPEDLTATQVRTLLNVEDGADVTDSTNVEAAGAVMESDTSTASMSFVLDEDNMASDSDIKLATQQSIKKYVDDKVVSSVDYKGGYNAATNTPDLDTSPSGVLKGDMYTVTAAGTFFTIGVEIGDVLIAEIDSATVEADWTIVNKNLDAASIKVSYESNADTNAFTNAEQTKIGYLTITQSVDLDTIESDVTTNNAKVTNATHTGDVTGSDALTIAADAVTYDKMQDVSATDKLLGRSTAGAGTVEEIACTAAGRALLDDADAAAQRTTLNVDVAGTDNSTEVTLAGTPDYLTIAGQVITRNQIDLAADVSGILPEANGGTNQSTYAQGDILYASATNTLAKLAKGTASHVLTMNVGGTLPEWAASAGGAALVNIFLPAEAAYLPVTNPASLDEELGATVYAGHSHLAYDDTTAESAVWRVPMPDYDGGNIVVTAYSKVATTPAGAVTLQYDILTIGLANSEAFDAAVTVDTTVNISHSLNTTELNTDIMVASATIDPANVAEDDLLVIELKRDVATDTLVGDGELVGIMLEYTRS